jgi:tight adherence protein C
MGGGKEGNVSGVHSVAIPDDSPAAELAQRLAEPLNKLLPPSATEAKKLQKKLMHAGFRSAEAPLIYRAIHLSSMAAFPLAVAGVCALTGRALDSALIYIIVAFVAGFFLPRFLLNRTIRKRQRLVRWGMADALDLMVVSVEAGLGLNAAMVKVASELRDVHPDVATEFELANLEIRVGRERDEALRNLAERTGVDDISSLVAMLVQTDKFGTSVAQSLRVHSDTVRTKRRQRAEEAAAKTGVKMVFPLVICIFPAIWVITIGPAAIKFVTVLFPMVEKAR